MSRYLSGLAGRKRLITSGHDPLDRAARSIMGSKPAAGLSVAEIGGSVGARFMRALGSDACFADAGYDEKKVGLDSCPVKNLGDLVDLDNYKHKLPTKYGLTISNHVFDQGSGIEAMVSDSGFIQYSPIFKDASMRLLAVFSNITKDKGLSVHGGFCVDLPDQFYEYLGMRCVHKEGKRFYNPLTVFEKRDPAPWLYPRGVQCGYDRIVFDKSLGEFCLSDQTSGGVSR